MANNSPRNHTEGGQALILAVFALIVTFGMAAMSIDIGIFLHDRQDVQTAVDAAALAGAQELPDNGNAARSIADQWAKNNEQNLPFASLDISFRCVVGDRDNDNLPDAGDVPAVCNPGISAAAFTCKAERCVSPCDPSILANRCNTVMVSASKEVPFRFAPVLSILSGSSNCTFDVCSTGDVSGVACRGSCGAPPSVPMDIVIILDRTSSMSLADIDEARSAALSSLTMFNPEQQRVALGVLSKAKPGDDCNSVANNSDPGTWITEEFSSDYQLPTGAVNPGSNLVQAISCLKRAVTSGSHTNLGDPTNAAVDLLKTKGRPGVKQAIILLTDGQANQPTGVLPCKYAETQASIAKAAGIDMFTLGFGLEGIRCDEPGSPYHDVLATELLADMATNSTDDSGCDNATDAATENADGDNFFCLPKSSDLDPVFKAVAAAATPPGSRLINLP